jgi:low temperature requirement protein LtrA
VAGIIAVAVGDDLLIATPRSALHAVGLAMVLGGPALYLVGESLFRLRMGGVANAERLAVAAILMLLAPLAWQISALALSATVAALLGAPRYGNCGPVHAALGVRLGHLRHLQQQKRGL